MGKGALFAPCPRGRLRERRPGYAAFPTAARFTCSFANPAVEA